MNRNDLFNLSQKLRLEHDEHMIQTHAAFMTGEEVGERWAYAAGMLYVIRNLEVMIEEDMRRNG